MYELRDVVHEMPAEALASGSGAINPDWTSSAVTEDVMSATEEPRPVLATSASSMPVGLKGSISAIGERREQGGQLSAL
jgi:hypothetical protein